MLVIVLIVAVQRLRIEKFFIPPPLYIIISPPTSSSSVEVSFSYVEFRVNRGRPPSPSINPVEMKP